MQRVLRITFRDFLRFIERAYHLHRLVVALFIFGHQEGKAYFVFPFQIGRVQRECHELIMRVRYASRQELFHLKVILDGYA